jgi:hypothetical protein
LVAAVVAAVPVLVTTEAVAVVAAVFLVRP